jgi:geranylgeranyl diphosphate synthase, type I
MEAVFVREEPRSATGLLSRARSLVDPVLKSAVEELPRGMRVVVGYHFGYWDETGLPTLADAGKAVRPALVLSACEFVGGRAQGAAPVAAAVELVHNFTLLHDDIMDGDILRRGRSTAWNTFGVPDAILAGDVLHAVAFRLLAEAGFADAPRALALLATSLVEVCEGQHEDCAFERRVDVGVEQCATMIEAKTGALLGCCCALGALAAGADAHTVKSMDQWGRYMGEAFQLVDDLLGIWGDPRRTGKPAHSDIASRKKSMPVVAALNSDTSAGRALARLYYRDAPLTDAEQLRAAEFIEATGARTWVETRIDALLERSYALLRELGDAEASRDLLTLGELIVRRDR